jgi:hypothetical protein
VKNRPLVRHILAVHKDLLGDRGDSRASDEKWRDTLARTAAHEFDDIDVEELEREVASEKP